MTVSIVFLLLSLVSTISTICLPRYSMVVANLELFQQYHTNIKRELAYVIPEGLRRRENIEKHFPGIVAELVHKDHHVRAGPGDSYLTSKEKVERDYQSSMRRAELIKRRLLDDSSPPSFVSNMSIDLNQAEYVMTISLGTPAQNFVAVADTGSDLTWLQCVPCTKCIPGAGPHFDPNLSSSYKKLTCSDSACQNFVSQYPPEWIPNCQTSSRSSCNYFYGYGDGTNTTGDFSTDVIHIKTVGGNITSTPNFAFGCSHTVSSDTGVITASVDGLVGLGQGKISFPSQLGSNFGDIFSYCLVSTKEGLTKTSTLLFGEAALSNSTGLQFTPILSPLNETPFYYVGLEGISVGGQQLNLSSDLFAFNGTDGGTIFDSGTTYTQLHTHALDTLANFLIANLSFRRVPSPFEGLEYCWLVLGMSDDELATTIPTITFRFTDANYDLSYENAFISESLFVHITCLAISRGGVFSSQTIIGNHQQRNKQIVYDRANKRLGFVSRDCAAGTSGSSSSSSASSPRDRLKEAVIYFLLQPIIALIDVLGVR